MQAAQPRWSATRRDRDRLPERSAVRRRGNAGGTPLHGGDAAVLRGKASGPGAVATRPDRDAMVAQAGRRAPDWVYRHGRRET